jgi:probable phosphoglycerate mutase
MWPECRLVTLNLSADQTRVLLMRHADVENPRRVLYGHLPGFGLSALGRAQAAAVGQSLRNSGIRRIVHSPLDRARETAEIVNAQLPAPVPLIPEPELIEAHIGRYLQGIRYWQIPLRRPKWILHKMRRGSMDGDESIAELGGRVRDVVLRLGREHPGEVSLCVSHADPIQAAWILFEGRLQTEREMYRKPVQRAGLLEIDLDGDRVTSLRYIAPPTVAVA